MKVSVFSIIKRYGWRSWLAAGLDTVKVLLITGLALVYGNLVNIAAAVLEGAAGSGDLLFAVLLSLGYSVFTGVFIWVERYYYSRFITKIWADLKDEYYEKIIRKPYADITANDSSKYVTAIQSDLNQVKQSIGELFWMVSASVGVIASFVSAVVLQWQIGLIMLGFTVFLGILPLIIKKPLDRQNSKCTDEEKIYARALKENLQGSAVIKSFSAEEQATEEIKKASGRIVKEYAKKTKYDAFAGGAGVMLQNLSILALVGITCYFVVQKTVPIGAVLSIVQIGMGFYGSILSFASAITYYGGRAGVRKRIFEVLAEPSDILPAEQLDFQTNLEFKDVNFAYPDKEMPAADGVNLIFEKNKKYLVLGKSGSGKSTLLKLIAKFYEPQSGEIFLDGRSYNDLREKDLSGIISYAMQTCYLFGRSFKENIDYLSLNEAGRLDEIIEFCALEDFVARLPQGINTIVDEEVNQVSGGEKLRINLARALYRKSQILLLDEVTSALDKSTSNRVERNLLGLADMTVVNVCHKFNDDTLPEYDKIFIIEDGKIVKEGSFSELKDDEILNRYRNAENMVQ